MASAVRRGVTAVAAGLPVLGAGLLPGGLACPRGLRGGLPAGEAALRRL
jgi:hypothetical protein